MSTWQPLTSLVLLSQIGEHGTDSWNGENGLVAWSKSGHSRSNSDIFMLPYRKLISFLETWDKVLQNRKTSRTILPSSLPHRRTSLSWTMAEQCLACCHISQRCCSLPNKSLGRFFNPQSGVEQCPSEYIASIFLFTVDMQTVHTSKYKTTLLRLRNPNYWLVGCAIKEKHSRNHISGSPGKLYFTK